MDEPNPNSPANSLAAQLYQENRREYEKRVQQIVEQSWLNFAENDGPEEKKPEDQQDDDDRGQSTSRGQAAVGGNQAAAASSGSDNQPQQ